ncbi:SHOCT domain-containing protein [Allohahella marinimesophila]|uniref:SHOCT domain-containing protein n=1 Tax=Allohahella marinimesophila TaxID=1054972 RepID=A0ABP7PMX0_9GAMM
MQTLTEYGQRTINDMASRYGVSTDAIMCMLYAVMNGNGTMAQFNCPEFGGGGQWMQGGMTMVGDMFNYGLKASVDNVCGELSRLLQQQEQLFVPVKKQSYSNSGQQQNTGGSGQQQSSGGGFQQQGQGGGYQSQGNSQQQGNFAQGGNFGGNNWWPDGLGAASSTGGQNNIRYAVFPATHRLAVELNGQVTVYDTLDHQIGGVSQQQGGDTSLTFSSQYGLVNANQLPIVSPDGSSQNQNSNSNQNSNTNQNSNQNNQSTQNNQLEQTPQQNTNQPQPFSQQSDSSSLAESDVFAAIEKLAGLKDKGYISEDEYSTKKTELLKRL